VSDPGRPERDSGAADAAAITRELGPPADEHTVRTLIELGVSEEEIRRAHALGRIEDAIFEPVLDPARAERTVTARQIEQRGGLTIAETQLVALSFGLAVPEPDEAFFTPDEALALQRFGELRAIWPPDVYLQIVRLYGQSLARIAETEANLFRLHVARPLRESGDRTEALTAVHEALSQLLPLADPLLLGVHRRHVEHAFAQAAVREAERATDEGALPGAVEVSLLFCDLKDFTTYTDVHGDAAAIAAIEHFGAIVTGELGPHGHVVKMLGDGFMLSFPTPEEAVDCFRRVVERMRADGSIGVHGSLQHAVAIYREGDYFGRSVNLAARLLAVAGRDELVASSSVAEATAGRFAWDPPEQTPIRGASRPVEIHRLRFAPAGS
jgi:adenylate cyclase